MGIDASIVAPIKVTETTPRVVVDAISRHRKALAALQPVQRERIAEERRLNAPEHLRGGDLAAHLAKLGKPASDADKLKLLRVQEWNLYVVVREAREAIKEAVIAAGLMTPDELKVIGPESLIG